MQAKSPTNTLIGQARRAAKALARSGAMTYSEALDRQAVAAGYRSWRELVAANAERRAGGGTLAEGDSLPLDPALPQGFYDTPNEERSKEEIASWWDRPFAVSLPEGGLDIRCLDGGAWDRPTFYGRAADMREAVELASKKLAAWRSMRDRPVALMVDDGLVQAVRMPVRPGEAMTVLSEPMRSEQLAAWMEAWRAQQETPVPRDVARERKGDEGI
jgi:hypothetical protein